MVDVTLRQLRYFEAVARHGSFARAAEVVAISQPAMSVQIRALEDALGARLFDRGPRDVRMTRYGVAITARVRAILVVVDELSQAARALDGGLAGPLRLGVIPTVGPYLVASLSRLVAAAFPEAELRLRETTTARLIDEVGEGGLDAAIVALPVSEPRLVERPFLVEPFVLVRPQRDAGTPPPSRAALAATPLLLLEEGHCFRDQALAFCGHAPRSEAPLDGSSLSTLVQMVAADMGTTLIPAMAIEVETRAAAVTCDRFAPPEPSRTVGLVWRIESPLDAAMRTLAAVLEDGLSGQAGTSTGT